MDMETALKNDMDETTTLAAKLQEGERIVMAHTRNNEAIKQRIIHLAGRIEVERAVQEESVGA